MLVILILSLVLNLSCPALVPGTSQLVEVHRQRRATSCVLPPFPAHGSYNSNKPLEPPGRSVDSFQLNVTCHPGYELVGSASVYCFNNISSQAVPKCIRLCTLPKDPSVHYRCLIPDSEEGHRECDSHEPSGTVVRPECKTPNYHANGILPYMRCIEGRWNHIAKCSPECGTVTPSGVELAAGGLLVTRGEFPWHTGVYTKTSRPFKHICGGSLVTTTVVISAAHCFYWQGALPASDFAVAAGKLYRPYNDAMDNATGAQYSDVKEIEIPIHFQGRTANFQDDIALLYMATPFVYETFVRPVCLDFGPEFEKRQLQPGMLGKVAGWGLTDAKGTETLTLHVVELPYVDVSYCISKAKGNFSGFITSDKFCAGYENKGTAVCQGDSGGGLVFPESERGVVRHYLRGVVSTAPDDGTQCNTQTFAAFTHLTKHSLFISENLYRYGADAVEESSDVDVGPGNGEESKNNISVAQRKCLHYRQQAARLSCAGAPYVALLGNNEDWTGDKFQGYSGVIVSDRYILTKATSIRNPDRIRVALDVKTRKGSDANWQKHEVVAVTVHPEYDFPFNNLVLLRTEKPIQFNERVQPACLPPPGLQVNDAVTTTWRKHGGWFAGDTLRIATVQPYSNKECLDVGGNEYNETLHTCFAHRDDVEESCWKEYGDPLVVPGHNSSCVSTVVGIYMFGHICVTPYGYIMLSQYVPWIEKIVWPGET